MKPGDIMIVFSLGAEATARCDLAFPEACVPGNGISDRIRVRSTARRPMRRRVRGGQIRTDRTSGSIWASRAKPMGRIRLRRQRMAVCITRDRRGPRLGTAMSSAMPRTSESGERNRAIGAHFPIVADIAAAAGLAARLAVRFKPCIPDDFEPRARPGIARGLVVVPRSGNDRSEAGITV